MTNRPANLNQLPIVDTFGRVHNSLRVSVTDRCNIRCFYCMPETVKFMPKSEVLTFEEIHRLVTVVAELGVDRIRITGGEPLVRSELWKLVSLIRNTPGINDVAITTNGILLAEQVDSLKSAGLDRINVSLDTMNEDMFQKITRRKGLSKVLDGIAAAKTAGFENIRVNAVSIKGLTENEIVPLAKFARRENLELRFIEFMPLDGDEDWRSQQVLTGAQVLEIIDDSIGELSPKPRINPSQPAVDYQYADGQGSVGFINSVSQPFCGDCNRMRVTAEGKFRNCLFSSAEWDVRSLLRCGATSQEITDRIRECVTAKKAGHGTDSGEFLRPQRAMYQIGG